MITPTQADLILIDSTIWGYRGEMTEYPNKPEFSFKAPTSEQKYHSQMKAHEQAVAAFKRDCLEIEDQDRAKAAIKLTIFDEDKGIQEIQPNTLYRVECRLEHAPTNNAIDPPRLRFKEQEMTMSPRVKINDYTEGAVPIPVADPEVREPHPYFDNPTAMLESLLRRTWREGQMYQDRRKQPEMEKWIDDNRFLFPSFLKVAPDNQEELWKEASKIFWGTDSYNEETDIKNLTSKFSISRKPQQP